MHRRMIGLLIAVGVVLAAGSCGHRSTAQRPTRGTPATTQAPDTAAPPSRPSMLDVLDVAMASDGPAWVLGRLPGGPVVLDLSTDGGATWRRVPLPQATTGTVQYLDPSPRITAAPGGRLWIYWPPAAQPDPARPLVSTSDLGAHWTTLGSAPTDAVAMAVVGEDLWALTDPCPASSPSCTDVLRTSPDGGTTWVTPSSLPVTTNSESAQILGLDAQHVLLASLDAAAGQVQISLTNDGGRSWASVAPKDEASAPLGCGAAALDGTSPSNIWLLCRYEKNGSGAVAVLRSHDGGLSWQPVSDTKGPPGLLEGITVVDGDRAFLSSYGAGPALWTTDGGRTLVMFAPPGWKFENSGTGMSVRCGADQRCVALGAPELNEVGAWHSTDGGTTWSGPVLLP